MGDTLLCTSAKTGQPHWSIKLKGDLKKEGGYLAAPPVAAGNSLFVATLAGQVLQLDPQHGGTKKTYEIGSPLRFSPCVENGRIYVGTQDGKLVCVDTGDRQLTGWPTWGGDGGHTNVRKGPPADEQPVIRDSSPRSRTQPRARPGRRR
jgi:outer membrane protein assembly factor BamB